MISALFKGLFQAFLSLLKVVLVMGIPIYILSFIFIGCLIYHYINQRYILHNKPNKSGIYYQKDYNFFYKIFYQFPKQLILDNFERKEAAFQDFGMHIAIGEQGSGKTMTMVYMLEKWRKMYPKSRIYTNFEYKHQNGEFNSWKDLEKASDDIYGDIFCVDELRTWNSKKDSGKMPDYVVDNIIQLRKQKQALFSTIQVFTEAPKEIRDQCHCIYVPKTILGCLTIVFKTDSKYYQQSTGTFRKYKGFFFFVHTPELRGAYDTFKVIENLLHAEYEQPVKIQSVVGDTDNVGDPTED